MSYLTQDEIASNKAMQARVAQAAAQEQVSTDPDRWTYDKRRTWAASPGWDAAWDSYKVANPPVEGEPVPDPGKDPGVITDGMILSQVQSMKIPLPA